MVSLDDENDNLRKGLKISSGERTSFQPIAAYRNESDIIRNGWEISRQVYAVVAQADCIVVRLPSLLGFIAAHHAIRLGKPWAAEVVTCSWDSLWNYGNIQGKIAALPYYLFQKHYIRQAPFSIYVSKKFLQHRYPCNGYSLGCSDVAITSLDNQILQKRLERINKGFKDRPIYFGLIGSLNVGFKGHETAIRALGLLKDQISDFRLCFLGIGDPERWRKLAEEQGIGDKVQFEGTRPTGQPVFDWMDNLDFYLIPSLQEGLPRALVEAMSRGCPALGARTGGIPELLQEECIHNKRDWKKLSEDIIGLVNNREMQRKCAVENFNNAQNYAKDILDKSRNEFWLKFKKYVSEKATVG